jgi:branched-chain amino acid transport system substrate-binding protein
MFCVAEALSRVVQIMEVGMGQAALSVRSVHPGHLPQALLAVGLALGAFGSCTGAAAETLKIGVLGPMSGSASQWGIELARGAEMRAQEINASGGLKINGKQYDISIVPYDHKSEAAEARTVTNRLVFADHVKFIAGNAIGATTSAAQTITEPNGVLFAFISWGIKNLGPDKPFSFRTDLSGLEVVEPFYLWIKEKNPGIKRVAAIGPNDESGRDSNSVIVSVAKKLGYEVVADEYYARETKDFYPLLTRVLATNPDYIDVSNSPGGSAGLLVKQMHELGYKGAKGWIGGLNIDALVKIAGKEAAEGTWSPWSLNFTAPEASPELRRFVEQYQKKHSEAAGPSAIANYITVDVLTRAMQQAGTTEPKAVMDRMVQGAFETMRGPLVIGGQDTYGINRQFLFPVVISEIREGQVIDVGKSLPIELKKALAK